MKKTEVPQDNEGLLEGKLREVCYAVDENGNYVTVLSSGWTPKNAALKQAWDVVNEKAEQVRQQVLDGKLSPLAYYLEKNIMDLKILSQTTGIARWRIKRHLKPNKFKKLKEDILIKYAGAFEITLEALQNINDTPNQKENN